MFIHVAVLVLVLYMLCKVEKKSTVSHFVKWRTFGLRYLISVQFYFCRFYGSLTYFDGV